MPAFNYQTGSVSIGRSTKKSEFDQLLNNTRHIKSGTCTFSDAKIFSGTVSFQSTVTLKGIKTFSATAISDGIPYKVTPTQLLSINPSDTNRHSVDCSSYVPSGTTVILARVSFKALAAGIYASFHDATASGNLWAQVSVLEDSKYTYQQSTIVLNSERKFWWSVDSANADELTIHLLRYWR